MKLVHLLKSLIGINAANMDVSVQNEFEDFVDGQGLKSIDYNESNDVYVVGYPKSGNTLMQHVLTHLVYGINGEVSKTLVNVIVPDVHAQKVYYRLNERCFFKSHNLPEKNYRKVIYIYRDGRSALLSYYHMAKNMGLDITKEDLYQEKVVPFDYSWSDHVEQWHQNPFEADILYIKYESFLESPNKQIEQISNFLALERTKDEIDQVAYYCSILFMKSLEKKPDWIRSKTRNGFKPNTNFIRTGKKKGFIKEVNESDLKHFTNRSAYMLKKLGYI